MGLWQGLSPQSPQFVQHFVQSATGNKLHYVVASSLLFANPIHRDNIGVMQTSRGTCFAQKPLAPTAVSQCRGQQHFQRDASTERLLLSLVNDTHAAATQLANNAIVPHPFQDRPWRDTCGKQWIGRHDAFHCHQRGEQSLYPLGQFGILGDVFAEGWTLIAPVPSDEFLGHEVERIAIGGRVGGIHRSTQRGQDSFPARKES